MPEFWVDSSIYLRSRDGVLAFDIAPRFWKHLVELANAGSISSPVEVYNELLDHSYDGDSFNTWIKEHKESLFTEANDETLRQYQSISTYVTRTYIGRNANDFLENADPWLIAHALASGGRIATNETSSQEPGPNRNTGLIDTRVKIPNIAHHFGVETVSLPTMLRAMGVNNL